jgi:hypothetical protein
MSSKDRKRRQAQWQKEKARIDKFRRLGPRIRAELRAKGCTLPFYDASGLLLPGSAAGAAKASH